MRIIRLIVGMLLLTAGLPILLTAGGLWTVGQHRDADGTFRADLEPVDVPGQALLVADLDGLLQRDAAFARAGDVRITATTGEGPAFVGLAPAADATSYLRSTRHTWVEQIALARGPLPVRAATIAGTRTPVADPAGQDFWIRTGTGTLTWTAGEIRNRDLALVVMTPNGRPAGTVTLTAELRPAWLTPTTWGGFGGGLLLIIGGMIMLARPSRPRELVYVVEPDRLPDVAARLGSHASVIHTTTGDDHLTTRITSRPRRGNQATERSGTGDATSRPDAASGADAASEADAASQAGAASRAGMASRLGAASQAEVASRPDAASRADVASRPDAASRVDAFSQAQAADARPATLADASPMKTGADASRTGTGGVVERPTAVATDGPLAVAMDGPLAVAAGESPTETTEHDGAGTVAGSRIRTGLRPPVTPQLAWPPLTRNPARETMPPIQLGTPDLAAAGSAATASSSAPPAAAADGGVASAGGSDEPDTAEIVVAPRKRAKAQAAETVKARSASAAKTSASNAAKVPAAGKTSVKRAANAAPADVRSAAPADAARGPVAEAARGAAGPADAVPRAATPVKAGPVKRQPRQKVQSKGEPAGGDADGAAGSVARRGSGGTPAARVAADRDGAGVRSSVAGPGESSAVPVDDAFDLDVATPSPRGGRRRKAADGEVRPAR